MDDRAFDNLTKSFAGGIGSRRRILRLLARAGVGGVLAGLGIGEALEETTAKSGGDKHGKSKHGNGKSGSQKHGKSKRGDGKSVDGQPVDAQPVDAQPVDEQPVDEQPQDNRAGDNKLGKSKNGDGKRRNRKSGGQKQSKGKRGDGKPVDGQPVDEQPLDGAEETASSDARLSAAATCSNEGKACTTAQKCCKGLTCIANPTSGTGKFCCLNSKVCGSRCCSATETCNKKKKKCVPIQGACTDPSGCPTPTNPCLRATCSGGVCGTEARTGANCDDLNPCTENDRCTAAGLCAGTQIEGCVLCTGNGDCADVPGADQCHEVVCGTQGFCVVEVTEGAVCDDLNPCTENDRCTAAGLCAGTQIEGCVLCTGNGDCADVPGADQCHEVVCGTQGFCVVEVTEGAVCDDLNPCTENDRCTAAGLCAGTQIEGCVLCTGNGDCADVPGADQCHEVVCGTQGFCVVEVTEGAVCDDLNPCTENDRCTAAGLCAGTQIEGCVLCTGNGDCADVPGADQCHEVVCGTQGFCVVEVTEGAVCDDLNPCTENDRCTAAGLCAGTQIEGCVLCTGNGDCADVPGADQCHEVVCGTQGFCVVEVTEGAVCDDLNPCTENDRCTAAGLCAGTQIEGCVLCTGNGDCADVPGADQCHEVVCGTQGFCVVEVTEGAVCDDLNPCTENDRCTAAGLCAGTQIEGCVLCTGNGDCADVPGADQCHEVVCGTQGFCVVEVTEGAVCDDLNPCTENDRCTAAGLCAGTQIEGCVLCTGNGDCADVPGADQCHEVVCGTQGFCVVEVTEGAVCDDLNPCTENDRCTAAGLCAGTQIEGCVLCTGNGDCADVPGADQCHEVVCGTQGFCVVEVTEGAVCDDLNPCTENDRCTAAGLCAGTQIEGCVLCTGSNASGCPAPLDQCQKAVCTNGVCGFAADEGKACNDGNPCTNNDSCTAAGICAGTPIAGCVLCTAPSDCTTPSNQCQQATCNGGVCGVENKPVGTGCNDNNPCTSNDVCTNGVCAGTTIVGCIQCQNASTCPTPSNQCQQATCNGGVCGIENKPNTATCNDNNPCTTNDRCNGAGVCAGTQVTCPANQTCCAAGSTTCTPGNCCVPSGTSAVTCGPSTNCCAGVGQCTGGGSPKCK